MLYKIEENSACEDLVTIISTFTAFIDKYAQPAFNSFVVGLLFKNHPNHRIRVKILKKKTTSSSNIFIEKYHKFK